MNCKQILLLSLLYIASTSLHGETPTVTESKTKLQALESKMSSLQQSLKVIHHQRASLTHELEQTEKEMSNTLRQLNLIQRNVLENKQQIEHLNQEIKALQQQMNTQQIELAKQLRARYKMGEYQPIKWLLNQENPYAMSQLFSFYRYLIKSRQAVIEQFLETQRHLAEQQKKLNAESEKQAFLEQQIKDHQIQLTEHKRYHAALVQSLDKDILNKQQSLQEAQRNKENLSRLIQTLTQQGLTTRHYPLIQIRRHLQKPVSEASIEKINQGLMFYTSEGAPVTAVSPGKVVFCDWLKGYGLLLILDHGAGYMSLYAHNQALLKQKGEVVDKGERIALVGHSGGIKKSGLYFEVRRNGKAIPPLQWLS